MPTARTMLLVCALFGAAGAMRAQDNASTPETEATPPEPPKCIPFPHEQEHWLVAKGMPYSSKRVMTCEVVEPDGTVVKGKRTQLEWRDSEGRTRIEQPDVLDPDMIMVRVVDPVEHIDWNFTIGKDVDKTAIMSRYSPRADSFEYPTTYQTLPGGSTNRGIMATPLIPAGPGFRYEELKSTYVNGVWCDGSRDSRWARPGEGNNKSDHNELEVTDTWFSVDLFTEVRWKMNDPSLGKYRNELINIDRSEPDAALFRPPAGYRVLDATPKKPVPESSPLIVIPARGPLGEQAPK
jgi:hypothetical protein